MGVSGEERIKVKVYRYNPLKDEESYYKTYKVSGIPYMSVKDVLEYIYENIDGTLAFPHHAMCGHGTCGLCTVVVNGEATRACQYLVPEDVEELTVEPLPKFKVIKDLVVIR